MHKQRFAHVLVIILLLPVVSCDRLDNIGIDGPDVTEASDALGKIAGAFVFKRAECRDRGFSYRSDGWNPTGVGLATCNDAEEFKGYFFYTRSLNYCLQIIRSEPCPPSGIDFNFWTTYLLRRCDFSSVYWLNTKKPLQGKILLYPGAAPGFSTICL